MYTASEIYRFARMAGFSPDQATTMTAVALAESRGNSRAHNPVGEDSRGLWQINVRAHKDLAGTNLYDPVENARAAFRISRNGQDISPWTTTHGGTKAKYMAYRTEAEGAARAAGEGNGLGAWTGSSGYGHRVSAGDAGGPAFNAGLASAPAAPGYGYSPAAPGYGPPAGYGTPGYAAPGYAAPGYAAPGTGAPGTATFAATPTMQPNYGPAIDTDKDGLTDGYEKTKNLNPTKTDTDNDGLADGYELTRLHTNPTTPDTDKDGIPDTQEKAKGYDPTTPDTDKDGQIDGTTTPTPDTDQDGLSDQLEKLLNANPNSTDTDNDGFADQLEYQAGYDITNPFNNPTTGQPSGGTPGSGLPGPGSPLGPSVAGNGLDGGLSGTGGANGGLTPGDSSGLDDVGIS